MTTISTPIVLDGRDTGITGFTRIPGTRVYTDIGGTVIESGGSITGEHFTLITTSILTTGTGDLNVDQCNIIITFPGDAATTSFRSLNNSRFSVTNSVITWAPGTSNVNLIAIHAPPSNSVRMVLTNTTFINDNANKGTGSTNANPGLNLAGIDPANSDITGLVLDGWWFNTLPELPSIGVNFRDVLPRTDQGYSIRVNAPVTRSNSNTAVSAIFADCTMPLNGAIEFFRTNQGITNNNNRVTCWMIDCTPSRLDNAIPITRNVRQNNDGLEVRLVKGYKPQLRDTQNLIVADAKFKFPSTSTYYNMPSSISITTPLTAQTTFPQTTSDRAIDPDGYLRLHQVIDFTTLATNSFNAAYSNFGSDINNFFSTYTHNIANNEYAFAIGADESSSTLGGALSSESVYSSVIDSLVQGQPRPTSFNTNSSNLNDIYRTIKSLAYEFTDIIDWSNIVTINSDNSVNLASRITLNESDGTSSITYNVGSNSLAEVVARTAGQVDISTDGGFIPGFETTDANGIMLNSVRALFGIDAPRIDNPEVFSSNPSNDSDFSFGDDAYSGTIEVDVSAADGYIVFQPGATVKSGETLNINRTVNSGTNDLFVVNGPTGAVFGTRVTTQPAAFNYNGASGDRVTVYNQNGVKLMSENDGSVSVNTTRHAVAVGETIYVAHSRRGKIEQYNTYTMPAAGVTENQSVTLEADLSANTGTLNIPPSDGSFERDSDVIWNSNVTAVDVLATGSAALPANTLVFRFAGIQDGGAGVATNVASNIMLNMAKDLEAYSDCMDWFFRILTASQRTSTGQARPINNLSTNATRVVNIDGSGIRFMPKPVNGSVTQQGVDNVTFPEATADASDLYVDVSATGTFRVTFQETSAASARAIGTAIDESLAGNNISTSESVRSTLDETETDIIRRIIGGLRGR